MLPNLYYKAYDFLILFVAFMDQTLSLYDALFYQKVRHTKMIKFDAMKSVTNLIPKLTSFLQFEPLTKVQSNAFFVVKLATLCEIVQSEGNT